MSQQMIPCAGQPLLLLPVTTWITMIWCWWAPTTAALQFQYASFGGVGDNVVVVQQSWYSQQFSNNAPNAYKAHGALWLTAASNASSTLNGASQTDGTNLGRAVYKDPIQFSASSSSLSFSTSFSFQIITTRPFPNCGSGMAFFIADSLQAPASSDQQGALGLLDPSNPARSPSFFAVEFDTHVSPSFQDPSASHIGIDINSMASLNVTDTSPSSSSGFYPDLFLYSNSTFTAWVEYNASTHLIQVWMSNNVRNNSHSATNSGAGGGGGGGQSSTTLPPADRPLHPCLQLRYDLSRVLSQSPMYVGFSATSSPKEQGMEGHVIFSWNFTNDPKEPSSGGGFPLHMALASSVAGAILALIVILACVIVIQRKRSQTKRAHAGRIENALQTARPFSYRELERATDGFDEARKVGEGGYGSVYKGILQDGSVVAVKKLRNRLMVEAQFCAEASIIMKVRHRYLLELQGWCYEEGREALLVSQYMSRGSLDRYLFNTRTKKELGSSAMAQKETRMRILAQVAAALEYLHGGLGECVLHRDVKAGNVLLTDDREVGARLCDFGMARLISRDEGAVAMSAAGTPGYIAPEVLYNGMATEKADVYSFGVLALEVACGRRAVSSFSTPSSGGSAAPAQLNLSYWLWTTLSLEGGTVSDEELLQTLDPILLPTQPATMMSATPRTTSAASTHDHHHEEVGGGGLPSLMASSILGDWRCVVQVGLMCCHPLPEYRPIMKEVTRAFDHKLLMPLPRVAPLSPFPFPWLHPSSDSSSMSTTTTTSSARSYRPAPCELSAAR